MRSSRNVFMTFDCFEQSLDTHIIKETNVIDWIRCIWFLTNRCLGKISHTRAFMNETSLEGKFDDNQLPNPIFYIYQNLLCKNHWVENCLQIHWKAVCCQHRHLYHKVCRWNSECGTDRFGNGGWNTHSSPPT